jgi:branched-chain amino acid transport system ATP-binding protein
MADPLLEIEALTAGYGPTVILHGLSLALAEGGSLAVIGRNGVGKTTLLASIVGHTDIHGGRMAFAGRDLGRLAVPARIAAGIGYVPQQREIFPSLTVAENLAVARRPGPWTPERACALFPRLAERRRNRGGELSGGEQQMLAIARALVGNPRLLLLDEPCEGLAPVIVEQLVAALGAIRRDDRITTVLVEQKVAVALAFADRALVLRGGRIAYDGAARALQADREMLDRLVGLRRSEEMPA